MTRPGASGSGQKIEERQEEYQAPTHASWPLWQTDKPSSSELLNLWSGKYERLLYRYTQLEKHCNVFFCHLVVRSTFVFYSTSNYRVSEKSISIFPQLGVYLKEYDSQLLLFWIQPKVYIGELKLKNFLLDALILWSFLTYNELTGWSITASK